MTSSTNRTECADCGAVLDSSRDTVDAREACSSCGSTKRKQFLSVTNPQPTNYFLDKFVSHRLSLLTVCGASDVPRGDNWLGDFIHWTAFVATPDPTSRAYMFNFLRRAEGALSAYALARESLIEHVSTPRNIMSSYFQALLNFEVAIAQSYQALELLAKATGEKVFKPKTFTEYERLHTLYIDSKHTDEMIDGKKIPVEATTSLWITNEGLESGRGRVSFREFENMLIEMAEFAKQLASPPVHQSQPSE